MRATGSTRMATRWSWFSAAALMVALTLGGCVQSTARFYIATAGDTRLDENELRVEADRMLRIECDRLKGGKTSVSGEGTYVLEVAASGVVERVKLTKSTGDATLDDIFGALSARLSFEPAEPKAGGIRMRASYFCEPDKAITTIEMT